MDIERIRTMMTENGVPVEDIDRFLKKQEGRGAREERTAQREAKREAKAQHAEALETLANFTLGLSVDSPGLFDGKHCIVVQCANGSALATRNYRKSAQTFAEEHAPEGTPPPPKKARTAKKTAKKRSRR